MPANKYSLPDGTRVPSVTTILGRFKDSGGLIHWAWKEGKANRDYRKTRDDAADIGTQVHDAIEQWLVDGKDPMLLSPQAETAFSAFRDWYDAEDLTCIAPEVRLVSEEHGYGGQFDLIAEMPGRGIVICDWKTSSGVYPDMLAQLAAYPRLVYENGIEDDELDDAAGRVPKGTMCDGGIILRLDKKTGLPEPHFFTSAQLDIGWEYFRHAISLYEASSVLTKAMKI